MYLKSIYSRIYLCTPTNTHMCCTHICDTRDAHTPMSASEHDSCGCW